MTQGTREAFEAYMVHSRRNKGVARRAALLLRYPDDTYVNDHVQRHWHTWQTAIKATQRPSWETAPPPTVNCLNLTENQ